MKNVRNQFFSEETSETEDEVVQESECEQVDSKQTQPEIEGKQNCFTRAGRRIKMPTWSKDFVCSTFRSEMPKTKVTPRLQPVCPACKERPSEGESWEQHLVKCRDSRINCNFCEVTFKKDVYLQRHIKIKHNDQVTELAVTPPVADKGASPSSGESSDSDWEDEPNVVIAEGTDPNDIMLGRTIRKSTTPAPVATGKRMSEECNPAYKKQRLVGVHREGQTDTKSSSQSSSAHETSPVWQERDRCQACGIYFKDIIMGQIHRGWHTNGAEYKCNVCGKECANSVYFMIHLTMGHMNNGN